jgi:hypothetical protein
VHSNQNQNIAPTVTIGLPVYNAMPYLSEAVESLLGQTVKEFDILAIVDGATDGSLEYLQSVKDPRLKILVQPNLGLVSTLNRILREVRTPWLVRQDADDVSYPHRIEHILEHIHRYPNAGMFYSMAEYHPRQKSLGLFRSTRGTPEELRRLVNRGYLLSICHPGVTLHVERTLAIGGYRSKLYVEDADLWWRMALEYEIHCIPEALIGFRQNVSSVSSQNLRHQMLSTLYVQYLLISHLQGFEPEPFENIASHLQALFPVHILRSKEKLRRFNMLLAEQKYIRASGALVQALIASPSYFLSRIRDEFAPGVITNGIDPKYFRQRPAKFWPRVAEIEEDRRQISQFL